MGIEDLLCRSEVYREGSFQVDRFLLMLDTKKSITLLLSPSPTSRDILLRYISNTREPELAASALSMF